VSQALRRARPSVRLLCRRGVGGNWHRAEDILLLRSLCIYGRDRPMGKEYLQYAKRIQHAQWKEGDACWAITLSGRLKTATRISFPRGTCAARYGGPAE
jgi:hypothetical protein